MCLWLGGVHSFRLLNLLTVVPVAYAYPCQRSAQLPQSMIPMYEEACYMCSLLHEHPSAQLPDVSWWLLGEVKEIHKANVIPCKFVPALCSA